MSPHNSMLVTDVNHTRGWLIKITGKLKKNNNTVTIFDISNSRGSHSTQKIWIQLRQKSKV